MALEEIGLDPDGHEGGAEIAFADGVEVDLAAAKGIGEVEVLVDEAPRCVFVGVDDESAAVDLLGGELLRLGAVWAMVSGSGCGECCGEDG